MWVVRPQTVPAHRCGAPDPREGRRVLPWVRGGRVVGMRQPHLVRPSGLLPPPILGLQEIWSHAAALEAGGKEGGWSWGLQGSQLSPFLRLS